MIHMDETPHDYAGFHQEDCIYFFLVQHPELILIITKTIMFNLVLVYRFEKTTNDNEFFRTQHHYKLGRFFYNSSVANLKFWFYSELLMIYNSGLKLNPWVFELILSI